MPITDLALIANVAPRVVGILNANPGIWSATVSGSVGAFPDVAEITAAILEADGELITRGYFNSINNALAEPFMTVSAPISRGGRIPFHYGNVGKVELSKNAALVTLNGATNIVTTNPTSFGNIVPITFFTGGSGTLPVEIVAGTTYYTSNSGTSFNIAATAALALTASYIDFTGNGSGTIYAIEWQEGVETESIDDIKNANAVGAGYVGAGSFDYFYKVEDNALFHGATWARIEVPSYARTVALQSNKADEPILIALAVKLLTKNASPALFEQWTQFAEKGIQQILRDGSYQPGTIDVNP